MTTILLLLLAAVLIWAFAELKTAGAAVAAVVGAIALLGAAYYIWRDVSDSRDTRAPSVVREKALDLSKSSALSRRYGHPTFCS